MTPAFWWDMNKCRGKKKNGDPCNLSARSSVERFHRDGGRELIIFFTCHFHAGQEADIRKAQGKEAGR